MDAKMAGWVEGGWGPVRRSSSGSQEGERAADRAREEIVSENGARLGHNMYRQFQVVRNTACPSRIQTWSRAACVASLQEWERR